MPSSRTPLDSTAVSLMLMLCVVWGMQQVAVKIAAPDMGPMMQLAVRSAIAALLVWGLIRWRGIGFSLRDGTLLPGIGAGLLFALEFICVSIGLQYTSASHMSVFLYTAPVFTVLGMHWFIPGEHLKAAQWSGVAAAFAGIAIAFSEGFSVQHRDWHALVLGDALGVLGGIFWAATTLLIRRSSLSEAPPASTLLYQLAVSAVVAFAAAWLMGQAQAPAMTPMVWKSLFFQTIVITFGSYLLWFWMLRRYLASRLSVFSFLTPMFGVAFGVLLMNDPLHARFLMGAGLVMAGVVLVNVRKA